MGITRVGQECLRLWAGTDGINKDCPHRRDCGQEQVGLVKSLCRSGCIGQTYCSRARDWSRVSL